MKRMLPLVAISFYAFFVVIFTDSYLMGIQNINVIFTLKY
jgi:hypothetical protein